MVKKDSTHSVQQKKSKRATLRDQLAIFDAPNRTLSDVVDQLGYAKLIQMINAGVDDFNSASNDCCLSLIMASRYMGIISALETMQDKYFQPAPRLLKKYRAIHENLRDDLTSVLSVYKKLKNTSKGLNWPVLNAYESEYPSAHLADQFKKMDAHLIHKPHFSSPVLGITSKGRNA